MQSHSHPNPGSDHPHLPTIKIHHPSSPPSSPTPPPPPPPPPPHHQNPPPFLPPLLHPPTPTATARRRIGVAVDLSDESAFAVRWSVDNYLRPGDAVILVHVSPTSVLFGADWGPLNPQTQTLTLNQDEIKKSQDDFDAMTLSKLSDLAKPLKEANFPYKIHIVKDHDMRERLCLEVERLGLSAVIMGSRGFGATKRGSDGKLGSVSDYCVHHCVCPVVVVRYPDDKEGGGTEPIVSVKKHDDDEEEEKEKEEETKLKGYNFPIN